MSAEVTGPRLVGLELLSNDGEVGLVGGETEHDEIGIGAAKDVMGVGIVVGLSSLPSDVVHDLVLAFA